MRAKVGGREDRVGTSANEKKNETKNNEKKTGRN